MIKHTHKDLRPFNLDQGLSMVLVPFEGPLNMPSCRLWQDAVAQKHPAQQCLRQSVVLREKQGISKPEWCCLFLGVICVGPSVWAGLKVSRRP